MSRDYRNYILMRCQHPEYCDSLQIAGDSQSSIHLHCSELTQKISRIQQHRAHSSLLLLTLCWISMHFF